MQLSVFVSGAGTLLEAMFAARLPVALVVADRQCRGLERASEVGVPIELIERTRFDDTFDREVYSSRIVDCLVSRDIDIVAMAGFGTVLGPSVFDAFAGRIINTHPALLPAFPGWHAVRDALDYGVKMTGCTIHVATSKVDTGPILAQEAVPVFPDDNEGTLHERIKIVERRLYVDTLNEIVDRGYVLHPR